MKRLQCNPRPNWESKVEQEGLLYHHTDDGQYWAEGTYYEFSSAEIDELEEATNELQKLCLEAGQVIINNKLYNELDIPEIAIPLIERSWNEEPPAIYGRMDLAYGTGGAPKLLEYNADTPTSLLEAAVIQWTWLQDTHLNDDQFNSIHDRLLAKWKELVDYMKSETVHFASMNNMEDEMTISYMLELAHQAGLKTVPININDIGWDKNTNCFVDMDYKSILGLFKLYPWEWMMKEEFGAHIIKADMFVMEPAWKMMFSNKGILAILWQLYPDHPNLLPAYLSLEKSKFSNGYVKKPMLGREGSNVEIHAPGVELITEGQYTGRCVYQQYEKLPSYESNVPVIGSWVVDGVSAGIGIRETNGLVTNNTARFVPHLFR